MKEKPDHDLIPSVTLAYIALPPEPDLTELIEGLTRNFEEVIVDRRVSNLGPGGPGLVEGAIILTFGAAAAGFLGALGKDLYEHAKNTIANTYLRVRGRNVLGAEYPPLEIRVTTKFGAELRFMFQEGLAIEEFETALNAIDTIVAAETATRYVILFRWNNETNSWEQDVAIRFGAIG